MTTSNVNLTQSSCFLVKFHFTHFDTLYNSSIIMLLFIRLIAIIILLLLLLVFPTIHYSKLLRHGILETRSSGQIIGKKLKVTLKVNYFSIACACLA